MNEGLRGDGVVEDVDGDCPPQDGRVVGDDDDDDFPLREGSSSGEIAPPEEKSAPTLVPPRDVMTHKYRGSIIVLSISKSVNPNEEQRK